MPLHNIPPVSESVRKTANVKLVNSRDLYPSCHQPSDAGLPMLVAENEHGRLVIALQGAHIMAFQPKGKAEMLWVSPKTKLESGQPIRGGIPLCSPWFGPASEEKVMHGFIRNHEWSLTSAEILKCGATRLVLELSGESMSAIWPYAFHFWLEVIAGNELKLKLRVKNPNNTEVPLAFAFHTYFAVPDIAGVQVSGLDGCAYIDKADNMVRKEQSGDISFNAMTDRVYLDVGEEQSIIFENGRTVIRSGAKSAVVWNAWDNDKNMPDLGEGNHKTYVCVERGDVADNAISLAAGDQYEIWMSLTN